MQLKFAKSGGFSNTMSGKMNAKNSGMSAKLLDLDDLDVQMIGPDFLSGKTLKKSFGPLDINLKKTNPSGTRFIIPESDRFESELAIDVPETNKNIKIKKNEDDQFSYISCNELNIQPASKQKYAGIVPNMLQNIQSFQMKDKNSIISALLRKGDLHPDQDIQIKVSKPKQQVQKIGPAEAKLRSLQNKNAPITNEENKRKEKSTKVEQQIGEQIQESISQDYGNQSFEKISGSQIKQSIQQSIAKSQNIKQSIRQSIRESIKSKSNFSLKEQISASIPKQDIQEEEVYEEIFEEMSASDELSKSKANKSKMTKQEDKLEVSASASKGFRTKTKNVAKSIRFAEQLSIKNQVDNIDTSLQQKYKKGDKLAEELIKQKLSFEKIQQKVASILEFKQKKTLGGDNKNLELLYKFKIQINRLLTSENFMSKLRNLTAFIGSGPNSKNYQFVSNLEDKLLGNVMERIHDLRVSGVTQSQLADLRKQYDTKIEVLLKEKQMSLRVEMDRKLTEKDMELKKMIAQLQQKFRTSGRLSYGESNLKQRIIGDKVEVESDYSIDSDQISWKMDLWQVLPDYEKKKLYDKQSTQVANFLTSALMNEIKQQSLNRSADISFEFPDDLESSSSLQSIPAIGNFSKSKVSKDKSYEQENTQMMKPGLNREQLKKQMKKSIPQKQESFPPIPGVKSKNTSNESLQNFTPNIGLYDVSKHPVHEIRNAQSVSEVVKILAKYKNLFLRKKNDLVRKIVKTLQTKPKQNEPLSSIINELRILNVKEIEEKDAPFVKAYEQQLIFELISIFNRCKNRKNSTIEEQMKKMYDRLVVTCQVKTAEASLGTQAEIIPHEDYIQLKMDEQDKKVKDILVSQICGILALEFAKQMPRRK